MARHMHHTPLLRIDGHHWIAVDRRARFVASLRKSCITATDERQRAAPRVVIPLTYHGCNLDYRPQITGISYRRDVARGRATTGGIARTTTARRQRRSAKERRRLLAEVNLSNSEGAADRRDVNGRPGCGQAGVIVALARSLRSHQSARVLSALHLSARRRRRSRRGARHPHTLRRAPA